VEVPTGTTVEVDVDLDLRQLDVRRHRSWVTEDGDYLITAALHSLDPHAATAHLHQPGV
jgi:hypothetical protein